MVTACALERFQFHPLDVDLDQVDARQVELVERQFPDDDGILIIDRLADELVAVALAQFEAAEAGRNDIVRTWNFEGAAFGRNRAVYRDGVEAIIDRDIAGQRIIDALLCFDGEHRSPTRHCGGPLDGMNTDIGAAIERHDAVAVMLAAKAEQIDRQLDFRRVERGGLEDLKTDAVAALRIDHAVVKPIDDHGSMIGGCQYEGQLASHALHQRLPRVLRRRGTQYESLGHKLTADLARAATAGRSCLTKRGHPADGVADVLRHSEISAGLRVICAEMAPRSGLPYICPGLIRI